MVLTVYGLSHFTVRVTDIDNLIRSYIFMQNHNIRRLVEILGRGIPQLNHAVALLGAHGHTHNLVRCIEAVSYTHLTLPTNREV